MWNLCVSMKDVAKISNTTNLHLAFVTDEEQRKANPSAPTHCDWTQLGTNREAILEATRLEAVATSI